MSSQGPSTGTRSISTGLSGCYGPTGNTQLPSGYAFSSKLVNIRDGSDWIAYKKQSLIFKDTKPSLSNDKGYVKGNNYRLDYLNGRFKCGACNGNAFSSST